MINTFETTHTRTITSMETLFMVPSVMTGPSRVYLREECSS